MPYAVAKQIADKLGDERVTPLAGFTDFDVCRGEQKIGIVFPCYIGRAPKVVLDFKQKLLPFIDKQNTYVFCVINYANSPATSYIDFEDIDDAWFEVKMPENVIVNSKAPKEERIKELLSDATSKVESYAVDIEEKKPIVMYNSARPVQKVILKIVTRLHDEKSRWIPRKILCG